MADDERLAMRLFGAALGLETNTFAPVPTSYRAFLDKLYFPPGQHPDEPRHQTAALWVARRRAKAEGYTIIEGSCYAAQPGGIAVRVAYERMRDEILGQLEAAMPVDGVILHLHGAMVAQGYDDCEGDLLERARGIVGAKCVIGVELDPHCHLTLRRCKHADIIVLFKEYPHTDFVARAEEVVNLVLATIRGTVKPVKSVYDCRTIATFFTSADPMRSFVDKIQALEGKDGVLSISIAHGFPEADVPDMGARVLVITDDRKSDGDRLAETLGRELISFRDRAAARYLMPDAAIDKALANPNGPVVIADTTDNAGSGAPSDNTTFIRKLMARGIPAAVGPVWDPIAVGTCFDAGFCARIPLRFGGKAARTSGPPVDAEVEVLALAEHGFQTFAGARVPLGPTAAIRARSVDVVLVTTRAQAMGIDLFTNQGIDPSAKKILVVKSNQHFYASFSTIAAEVIYADGDGPITKDITRLPFKRVQRPIWPLDATAEPRLIL
jgi:microcystin degradation protein MlrC